MPVLRKAPNVGFNFKRHILRLIRKSISKFLLLFPFFVYGQTKGDTINIFQLKQKSFFRETNSFKADSSLKFRQDVSYNEPYKVDEEYSHLLIITIFDKTKLDSTKTFDLTKDSSSINCVYDKASVWNWGNEKTSLIGQVTVVSMTSKKIKLKLEITVLDLSHQTHLIYNGVRTFTKVNKIDRFPL